jgi:hypothetical protein
MKLISENSLEYLKTLTKMNFSNKQKDFYN